VKITFEGVPPSTSEGTDLLALRSAAAHGELVTA